MIKIFELTAEQRSKLLSMIKALYKEYNSVSIKKETQGRITTVTKGVEFKTDLIAFPFVSKASASDYIAYKYIHWLEYCMFELAERIFFPNPLRANRNLQNQFKDFYWSVNLYWSNKNDDRGKHPVDYLFEEFQKLK